MKIKSKDKKRPEKPERTHHFQVFNSWEPSTSPVGSPMAWYAMLDAAVLADVGIDAAKAKEVRTNRRLVANTTALLRALGYPDDHAQTRESGGVERSFALVPETIEFTGASDVLSGDRIEVSFRWCFISPTGADKWVPHQPTEDEKSALPVQVLDDLYWRRTYTITVTENDYLCAISEAVAEDGEPVDDPSATCDACWSRFMVCDVFYVAGLIQLGDHAAVQERIAAECGHEVGSDLYEVIPPRAVYWSWPNSLLSVCLRYSTPAVALAFAVVLGAVVVACGTSVDSLVNGPPWMLLVVSLVGIPASLLIRFALVRRLNDHADDFDSYARLRLPYTPGRYAVRLTVLTAFGYGLVTLAYIALLAFVGGHAHDEGLRTFILAVGALIYLGSAFFRIGSLTAPEAVLFAPYSASVRIRCALATTVVLVAMAVGGLQLMEVHWTRVGVSGYGSLATYMLAFYVAGLIVKTLSTGIRSTSASYPVRALRWTTGSLIQNKAEEQAAFLGLSAVTYASDNSNRRKTNTETGIG